MTNTFRLVNASCVDQKVDAIVNAANNGLWAGGGICGAIFAKAGMQALTDACSKYQTPLVDGSAVITPSFGIANAEAIIHAVGPNFSITPKAFKELFDAYYNSLVCLMDNGYHSIAFPLISSGIFGGNLLDPVGESAKQCVRAYEEFKRLFPEYGIEVILCAYTIDEFVRAAKIIDGLDIKDDYYIPEFNKDVLEEAIIAGCKKLNLSNETIVTLAMYSYKNISFQMYLVGWLEYKIDSKEEASDQEALGVLDKILNY